MRFLTSSMRNIFFFLFFIFGHAAFASTDTSSKQFNTQFTLNQISKINTATLEGRSPSHTFYFPLPKQWDVTKITLNLIINFSTELTSSSSLTLMVDNTPFKTIKLNKNKDQPFLWTVEIPKQLFSKKEILTLRVIGYLVISDDICQDLDNRGNWVTISGNSSIQYAYRLNKLPLNLNHFPFPFIEKNLPMTDRITFILPTSLSRLAFEPAFLMSNVLAQKSSWRGIEIDLNPPLDRINTNQILIATANDFEFETLDIPLPFTRKDGQWIGSDKSPLSTSSGFVYLTPSPYAANTHLLIISGNTKEALLDTIANINRGALYADLTTPQLYLSEPIPEKPQSFPKKFTESLKSLGYSDGIVFGDGLQSVHYHFMLTPNYQNEPVKLIVNYSHSPFLSTDTDSLLIIKVNDVPLNGIALTAKNANIQHAEFTFPPSMLKLGKNKLDISFDLRFNQEGCSRYDISRAWGIIYDSTQIIFNAGKPKSDRKLKNFNVLMSPNVTISLPEDKKFYRNKKMLLALINFAKTLRYTEHFQFRESGDIDKTPFSGNELMIGSSKQDGHLKQQLQTLFDTMSNNLNLTTKNSLRNVNIALFQNAFKKNQNVGFIGIMPSQKNPRRTNLVVFGYTPEQITKALSLLIDPYTRSTLTGNLTVAFNNGTYTTLSSKAINEQIETELRMERTGRITLYALVGFLLIAFIGLTLYFIANKIKNQ